jgi:hypothetical protein
MDTGDRRLLATVANLNELCAFYFSRFRQRSASVQRKAMQGTYDVEQRIRR